VVDFLQAWLRHLQKPCRSSGIACPPTGVGSPASSLPDRVSADGWNTCPAMRRNSTRSLVLPTSSLGETLDLRKLYLASPKCVSNARSNPRPIAQERPMSATPSRRPREACASAAGTRSRNQWRGLHGVDARAEITFQVLASGDEFATADIRDNHPLTRAQQLRHRWSR
jgi:hypothetical protein